MKIINETPLKETRSVVETGFAMYHDGTEQFMEDMDTNALVFEYEGDALSSLLKLREKFSEDSAEFEKLTRVVPVVFRIAQRK